MLTKTEVIQVLFVTVVINTEGRRQLRSAVHRRLYISHYCKTLDVSVPFIS